MTQGKDLFALWKQTHPMGLPTRDDNIISSGQEWGTQMFTIKIQEWPKVCDKKLLCYKFFLNL